MKTTISAIFLAVIMCGCLSQSVPKSEITIGDTHVKLPKNAKFDYMEVKLPTTNGAASLVISNGSFVNDPAVLGAVTAHDVAVVDAITKGISAVVAAGAKGASPIPK